MRARAAATEERREAVLRAAYELVLSSTWDEVTLERIAQRAGVGVKTIVRQFGSKDALLVSAVRWHAPSETAARSVAPGDVEGAVRILADRYEELSPLVTRYLPLEDRIPAVAEMVAVARSGHLDWLATTFAEWLPSRPAERRERLAALFCATEIYVWHVWRQRFGWSRRTAEGALRELLLALEARWAHSRHRGQDGGSGRKES